MNELIKGLDLYEIDSLDITYQLLVNDKKLMNLVGNKNQIFKYHVPEEFRELPPIVRISPISELPTEYADNEQLAWDCILQIDRSEEHTSELQSRGQLVCRLLL